MGEGMQRGGRGNGWEDMRRPGKRREKTRRDEKRKRKNIREERGDERREVKGREGNNRLHSEIYGFCKSGQI